LVDTPVCLQLGRDHAINLVAFVRALVCVSCVGCWFIRQTAGLRNNVSALNGKNAAQFSAAALPLLPARVMRISTFNQGDKSLAEMRKTKVLIIGSA
jgi:hypothetical protein